MKTWRDWETIHQPFELQYHIEQGIGWCADESRFWNFWEDIFDFVGVKGKRLDVGCGPRPPFGSDSTAIDPLALQYRKLNPHWWHGVKAFATAAETRIEKLEGRFDTVLCWNCLDHTIGWREILTNLASYGNEGAVFAIATDFKPPSIGHPGFTEAEFYTELAKHFEIERYAKGFQDRDVALVLRCAQ